MEKILISACLAGDLVRYDGQKVPLSEKWLETLFQKGFLYKYCPEVAGGMSTPRPPAEIIGGTGRDVLSGCAVVRNMHGDDVTKHFIAGAERALSIVRTHQIRVALLKERSPSCGSSCIYDGSFTSSLIEGAGVTAELLANRKVKVFSEIQIQEFKSFVKYNFSKINF